MEDILRGSLAFKGERGYSAYEVAVQNGFEGTVDEWLALLAVNEKYANLLGDVKTELDAKIQGLVSGTPLVASSTSGMTDKTHVYVNTTDGNWYYHNGSSWVSGGVYQATRIADSSIDVKKLENELRTHIKANEVVLALTEGSYIASAGRIAAHTSYNYSEPILLKKGNTIALNAIGQSTNVAFVSIYNLAKGTYKPVVTSTSSNEVRVSYTPNEDCYVVLSGKIGSLTNVYMYEGVLSDYNDITELENADTIISKLTVNKYIAYTTGVSLDHTQRLYAYEEYMPIIPNVDIVFSSNYNMTDSENFKGIAFYDDNLTYISGEQLLITDTMTIKTPENARYMRFTVTEEMYDYGFKIRYNDMNEVIKYVTPKIVEHENKISKVENDVSKLQNNIEQQSLFSSFIKFGVIGDSLASGECYSNEDGSDSGIDLYQYSWGQFIARRFGMECVNFSKGGMSTRNWLANSQGLTKLLKSENLCNAYIIGLGVNDANKLGTDYLGTIDDIKEDYNENSDTFYGNYGRIIGNVFNIAPKAKIFVLTMPRGDEIYTLYNDAIREIANHFDNVYLIDLFNSVLSEYISGFIVNNKREGHYNAMAYNYMATLIFNEISNYMYDNYSEFNQIEFINTDYEYQE